MPKYFFFLSPDQVIEIERETSPRKKTRVVLLFAYTKVVMS